MTPDLRKILDDEVKQSHARGILGPSQFATACRCPVCQPNLHQEEN